MAVASTAAHAQTYEFAPWPPEPQRILILVTWSLGGKAIETRSVVVTGNSVAIRFVQDGFFGQGARIIDALAVTPPLAPGVYTFTITWVPDSSYTGPPLVPQVFTITAPIPASGTAIPTLSDAGSAALALLLSLAGWFALRRRSA